MEQGFYKRVLILALPIAAQSLITIGVNMLDNIMVGQIGETELSAVALANQFINIYHILCMGLGMGASVLVSRYWGMREKEPEKAMTALRKTICIMVRLTVSLAAVFALLTYFIPEQIMSMFVKEGEDLDVIANGITYLEFSVITFFFLGLSLTCTIVLRSVGQVKMPLYVSMGAFFVNLGANYALIFGHFGLPKMGIAGAALGTLIARIYETSVICGYLFFVDKKIGFRLKHLMMKTGDLIGEYIRISIPVLISDGILAAGNTAVAMVIGRLGKAFVAANSVTATTQMMSSVMIQGVCQAGAIVTGQTLGEGEKEKAQRQGYGFLGFGIALGLISAAFIVIVSEPIIKSFNLTEGTAAMARQLMNAISLIVVFQATNSIMTKGVLRGGGDTKMLMLADNVFLWVLSIPLGIAAGFFFHFSPFWIYICLKSDQITKAIWCVIRLHSGKWIKKIKVGKEDLSKDLEAKA
ncbi:MAG: MATE family efflux transporter [Lachnospiraceae bacterium]|nr:MATE family efflux transporter [Lachnospiraceae bacterium]